ncbi:MAG: signal peptidase II [Caulobacteraceae bacterium]|nr:signal peptidase II [Caulobacteraceae bacterium]
MSQDTPVRHRPLGPLAYGLGFIVVFADQVSKAWILKGLNLPLFGSVDIAGPLRLTLVWNRGVSFGLFRADADLTRWILAAFSLGVSLFLINWARKIERPRLAISVGLILGGAIGNLIDRVRWGAVCDFIDASALHFPWVFNLADSAITIGVILLLIDNLLTPEAPTPLTKTDG